MEMEEDIAEYVEHVSYGLVGYLRKIIMSSKEIKSCTHDTVIFFLLLSFLRRTQHEVLSPEGQEGMRK
jgi:hypothetical protein